MSKLKKYQEKRDFTKTSEPSGAGRETQGDNDRKKLRFMVHKHDATQLHYDLRLELDGVLLSFAIPKGIPMIPSEKHLAMHVEDHPFEYKDFEGVIPEGSYGAGPSMIWDEGTYHHISTTDPKETQDKIRGKIKEGEFKFILHGKKLKGEFAMFRFKF